MIDTSQVKRTNPESVTGLQIDLKRLEYLLNYTKPRGANAVRVIVEEGAYLDGFRFIIEYGQRIGDKLVPKGRVIERYSEELQYSR